MSGNGQGIASPRKFNKWERIGIHEGYYCDSEWHIRSRPVPFERKNCTESCGFVNRIGLNVFSIETAYEGSYGGTIAVAFEL